MFIDCTHKNYYTTDNTTSITDNGTYWDLSYADIYKTSKKVQTIDADELFEKDLIFMSKDREIVIIKIGEYFELKINGFDVKKMTKDEIAQQLTLIRL